MASNFKCDVVTHIELMESKPCIGDNSKKKSRMEISRDCTVE